MKKLKDNLFAVEVPLWSTQHELYDTGDHTVIKYPAPHGWGRIKILQTAYKIIGTITEDTIDFDVRPYLTGRIVEGPPAYMVYRIANHFGDWPYTDNPIEAFRSYLYWFYFPDNAPKNPDEWPTEIPLIKEKLLLLQMVNFTSENW
ncbi:MAG: hypothetical protein M0D53_12460 [Flavobacterium sp. JAD_PAG50586_2]|nr:MAG: hypothetical protein M0D53_12460 [Flavobacterium sp. JAD_PAG50586_2]